MDTLAITETPTHESWTDIECTRPLIATVHLAIFKSSQTSVRLTQNDHGFIVTLSRSKPTHDAVSITRWKFDHQQGDAAAARLLDLALMIQGENYAAMRARSIIAITKADHAETTTPYTEPTVFRQLLAQKPEIIDTYIDLGCDLMRQYAEIEGHIIQAGFDPGYRPIPAWMDEIHTIRNSR